MTCGMAEKMPLRVHVKGKRKAPAPPANWKFDNKTSGANDAWQNVRDTRTSSTSLLSSSSAAAAMTTPINEPCASILLNHEMSPTMQRPNQNEMNNLSAVSSRMQTKSPTKATTNLNIFDTNAMQTSSEKELNMTGFDVNANQIPATNHFDAVVQANRNNEVWICTNCTLQNPFWKIVCDACERIKPYNTPNVRPTNGFQTNDLSGTIERKNFVVSVQIRPKLNRPIAAKGQQRNSMLPGFQYHVPTQLLHATDMELVANKRNSLCASDMTKDKHELEVEKERIRLLIRSLNNRALTTQTRPTNVVRLNNRFWPNAASKSSKKAVNMCQPNVKQQQQQNQVATSTKQLQSFNMRNDYNFPAMSVNKSNHKNKQRVTVPSEKIDVLIQINKKLDRPNKGDKYYACADDMKRAIDPMRCDRAQRQRPADVFDESYEPMVRINGSLKNNDENKMSLNVFINFNKAIQVNVPHAITLKRFKCHITKMIAPCECPKIYFNGLQLQTDDQTLATYGILDGSSIYVNTENVIAHTKSSPKAITSKSISVQSKTTPTTHNVPNRTEQTRARYTEPNQPAIDLNISTNRTVATLPVEQNIKLNRLEIDKFHPKNENITLTKYRGVYNYNPRCNPNLAGVRDEEVRPKRWPAAALNQSPRLLPPSTRLPSVVQAVPLQTITGDPSSSAATIDAPQETNPSLAANVSQYIELLSLDDSMDLTRNTEPFECPICLMDYQSLEGIVLRNCLHTFCMDCGRNSILHSDDAEVRCPYIDNDYSCEYVLQDREIKGVLSKSEYDEYLAKSLRIAEHQIQNSFHCRTPNCKGWCIYEDDVNTFKCPICQLVNCLTCRVIHDGLDCKQYQTMMTNNVDNNPENVRTTAMLEEMVRNGDAMHCPACRVILMKKWGCDWLKCSMCKTEICWVTRGPRWGPAGKGDTSAGCRCGVDGFRCHPKCNYCH